MPDKVSCDLLMSDVLEMKAGLARFLEASSGEQGFCFQAGRGQTVLSDAFGAALASLMGEPTMAAGAVERITARQLSTGHFSDPLFSEDRCTGSHSFDYIQWQITFFGLSALDMLGGEPRHDLAFMSPLRTTEAIDVWLEGRRWENFWYSSNEVMFLLYFLTYLKDPLTEHVLDRLDERQDPSTGLWGTDLGASLPNGVYGAAHVMMFYDYFGREIRHPRSIIDSTLGIQTKTGLWGKARGGACEDYDAIDILHKVGRQCPHRRDEVCAALARTRAAIVGAQSPDGGFPYCIVPSARYLKAWLSARKRRNDRYKYSGWRDMEALLFESDLWGTWFRVLSVATIDTEESDSGDYDFYSLPAWGYARRATT